ncbi:MAG: hypothetical protein FD166_847 [Bacteroidetes bacterium]|nr:MAG: hypothetical protein FD166_847 [Bacteroidota bacterium]
MEDNIYCKAKVSQWEFIIAERELDVVDFYCHLVRIAVTLA